MTEEYETDYTDTPICPWCGHNHYDAFEWFMENGEYLEKNCDSCKKPIEVSCSIDVSYCTEKVIKESKDA